MEIVDEIFRVFQERGKEAYFGEPVSQEEHERSTDLHSA